MKSRRLAVGAIPIRRRVADETDCLGRSAGMPATEKIISEGTARLAPDAADCATAPVISRLRRGIHAPKQAELDRLFHKLPQLDDHSRAEIEYFADRLVDKMLHPLLESLRDASKNGTPTGLLESLRRLFMLED